MPSATAFVAGATGYTGREVVRSLLERGATCVAHVRPDSPRLTEWRERFVAMGAAVDTTPFEADALRATFERLRPTLVMSLLGTTRARMREEADATYEAIDFGLTALLIDAAVAAGSRPRFVYLSAAGVKEGGNAYYRARYEAEQKLIASGLEYTIARPSFITGADRDEPRLLERTGAVVVDGALAVAGLLGGGRLRARYRSASARELAAGLVRAALDPATANEILHSESLR